MEQFTKATLAEIREKAFTNKAFEALLDMIPEGVPEDTIFYDSDYLHIEAIEEIMKPELDEIKKKYPFVCLYEDVHCSFIECYFLSISPFNIDVNIVRGTELEYVETLFYRKPVIV